MMQEEQRKIAAVVGAGFLRLSEGRLVNWGALQRLARLVAEDADEVPASPAVWEWMWLLKRDMR